MSPRSIWTRCSRSRAVTTSAPSRCRAIRRSCATSRFWSAKPCLRAPFVALSVRRRRRRWSRSSSSIATRAKGVPEGQISLSLRLTFRAPDRTLTDEEVQAAMDAIVAALAHDARRRATLNVSGSGSSPAHRFQLRHPRGKDRSSNAIVDLEPIDRLEEKVKHARRHDRPPARRERKAAEENARLAARARRGRAAGSPMRRAPAARC